jgi:hypothetical protein
MGNYGGWYRAALRHGEKTTDSHGANASPSSAIERRSKRRLVISAIVSLGILGEEGRKDSLLIVSETATSRGQGS